MNDLDRYQAEQFDEGGELTTEWDDYVVVWQAAKTALPDIANELHGFLADNEAFKGAVSELNATNSPEAQELYARAYAHDPRTVAAILRLYRGDSTAAEVLYVLDKARKFYAEVLEKHPSRRGK